MARVQDADLGTLGRLLALVRLALAEIGDGRGGLPQRVVQRTIENRGAIHMPAVPQTEVTSGKLSNDQLTRYSTLSTALKAIVFETDGPGRWQPCILHRTRPLNGTYAPWTFTNFFKTVRVQRRRTVGLGK